MTEMKSRLRPSARYIFCDVSFIREMRLPMRNELFYVERERENTRNEVILH